MVLWNCVGVTLVKRSGLGLLQNHLLMQPQLQFNVAAMVALILILAKELFGQTWFQVLTLKQTLTLERAQMARQIMKLLVALVTNCC
jgi:hypothetical protein